jgi:hypothetical protein
MDSEKPEGEWDLQFQNLKSKIQNPKWYNLRFCP